MCKQQFPNWLKNIIKHISSYITKYYFIFFPRGPMKINNRYQAKLDMNKIFIAQHFVYQENFWTIHVYKNPTLLLISYNFIP